VTDAEVDELFWALVWVFHGPAAPDRRADR